MSVVFEADARVINATAGTSVVVTKPTGTANGDVIYAVIAAASNTTISTPSGWTSLGTDAASTSVRASLFRRVCDGTEPASWTWTLGASVRNWGWVGRYSGVNTTTPENAAAVSAVDTTAGISFATGSVDTHNVAPRTIAAVAAVRTASGAATTWTSFADPADERDDLSTNAGSGTDITGAVIDETFGSGGLYANTFTASLSCTAGVMWVVSLNPAFAAYDGGQVEPIVEAALGADPDDPDPESWVWTDISAYVREADGVTITKGRQNEQAQVTPTNIRFAVNNDGRFTPGNVLGAYYPDIRRGLPIRVSVPYGYAAPTEQATAFVESYELGWDTSLNHATVTIGAVGRLSRLRAGDAIHSPMYRTITGVAAILAQPQAYWPMEDGADARQFAAERGGLPMPVVTGVQAAQDSTLVGSASLPTIVAGGQAVGHVESYTATGQWSVIAAVRFDAPVAAETVLLDVRTNGTASAWRLSVAPATPDLLRVQVVNSSGTEVVNTTTNAVELALYGGWQLIELSAVQNGANIDYVAQFLTLDGDSVSGQTVNGTLAAHTAGAVNTVASRAVGLTNLVGAFGHFALFSDPAFVPGIGGTATAIALHALDGVAGEDTSFRFTRLLREEGIYEDVHTNPDTSLLTLMGPQPIATMDALLREVEDAEQGVVHDGGLLGGLVLIDRASRYNRPVDLALDMDSGHIAAGWAPTHDTQLLRTRSTVSRTGGSSATYTGDTTEGIFAESLALNLPADERLLDFAGWRVNVGTAPGMRYPKVGVDFRRNPDLVEDWLVQQVGLSRITATNLPTQHGPVDVDGFMDGYTMTLKNFEWAVDLNLSPASPYAVGVWENPSAVTSYRWDGSASTTSGSITTGTSTSVSVVTPAGYYLWTTAAGDMPFDIDLAGARVRVTNVTGASSPQTLTISTTVVNGVAKAVASGTSVRLWQPGRYAL